MLFLILFTIIAKVLCMYKSKLERAKKQYKYYPNYENILKKFRLLRLKSNNKIVLTKKIAIYTDDMIKDNIL